MIVLSFQDILFRGLVISSYDNIVSCTKEMVQKCVMYVGAAANELRDKTPLPMNSMLQKEDRTVAVERRQARQKMEVVNVPPTTPCKLCLLSMYQ